MEIFASIFLGFICNGFSLLMLMCSSSLFSFLSDENNTIKHIVFILLVLLYITFIIGTYFIFASVFNAYILYYILGYILLFVFFMILKKIDD